MDDAELQTKIADLHAELERRRFESRRTAPPVEVLAVPPPPTPRLGWKPCPVCGHLRPLRGPCPGCTYAPKKAEPVPAAPGILDSIGAFYGKVLAVVREQGFERFLGERLFAYVGMLLVVLGGAFFLKYAAQHSGPWGRVAVGTLAGIAVVGAGDFLRRLPRFKALSVPVGAGGWALLTYTAYAAHAVSASKVVSDPRVGLALLVLAAGGMIANALAVRSRLMTAFAFLASYFAFAATDFGPQTLGVCTVLGLSAAWLSRRLRQPELVPISLMGFAVNYWPTLQHAFQPEGLPAGRVLIDLGAAAAVYAATALAAPAPEEDSSAAVWTDGSLSLAAILLGVAVHAQGGLLEPWPGAGAGLMLAALFIAMAGRSGSEQGAERAVQGFLGAALAALAVWRLPGAAAQLWGFVLVSTGLALSGVRMRREAFERYALALSGLGALTCLNHLAVLADSGVCAGPLAAFGLAGYALANVSAGGKARIWLHAGFAASVSAVLCWGQLDASLRLPIAALGSISLLWLGRRSRDFGVDLRSQAYLLAAATPFMVASGAPHGPSCAFAALALLTPLAWRPVAANTDEAVEERGAGHVYPALSLSLLGLWVSREAAGSLITLWWTALGGAYLLSGLAAQRRELRWPALALLGLCVAKAFLSDLTGLALPYRVLSMTALGLLMVLSSLAYVRLVKEEPSTLTLGEQDG